MPGIVAIQGAPFTSYAEVRQEMERLNEVIRARGSISSCPMIILCDDSEFMSATVSNFLWATFTRSNPSHDIHGLNSRYEHKHWGCDTVIIDARTKPHQAPPLIPDEEVERSIKRLFADGGSLSRIQLR